MNRYEQRKNAILSKYQAAVSEKDAAVLLKQKAEESREELRADLMTILGRITALKTIWALIPEPLRQIVAKYTDATP